MTLSLVIILTLLDRYGTGAAIPITSESPGANSAVSLPVISTTPKTRSPFDIFWTCWTTIFICTWTSMHPNIPPLRQGAIRAVWKRIMLMFWALLVPELVLTWAVKQWLAARAIEKQFKKDHKWTRTHAHFLGMGGFMLASMPTPNGVSEVPPQVPPNLTLPTQPKRPERNVEDTERYWAAMDGYWEELKHQKENRWQFWTDWENAQKNCSDYIYSNVLDNRRLQKMDLEDYQQHEMYGFPLHDRVAYLYECPGTLSFYRFRELVDKSIIAFPTITTAEIKDRSKGDFLSKAIAIFHTTWFIVQCVARGVQGLAITELELITLALASLNGVTYFFWWDKPLGVQEPVTLYFRGMLPVERNENEIGFFVTVLDALRRVPRQLSSTFNNWRISAFYFLLETHKELKISHLPILFLRCLLYLPIATVVKSLYTIIDTSDVPPSATHVPMFYATNVSWSNLDTHFIYFALPLISIVFGGLHCVGWNFAFPTLIEQILWRVSSASITVIPLVTGLVWSSLRSQRKKFPGMKIFLINPALALLAVYVLARLTLLVQALALLWREPTKAAYIAVDWSKYLPHIS